MRTLFGHKEAAVAILTICFALGIIGGFLPALILGVGTAVAWVAVATVE